MRAVRHALRVGAAALLAGCGTLGGGGGAGLDREALPSGIGLDAWMHGVVTRSAELPIAQALVVEEGGPVHLSFLGEVDPAHGDAWRGASGTTLHLRHGRVQRSEHFAAQLREAVAIADPVADWIAGRAALPQPGARSVRLLRYADSPVHVMERRTLRDVQLGPVAVRGGVYSAVRLREELRYDGLRGSQMAELWVDAASREVLYVATPVQPRQPPLRYESVVPVQRAEADRPAARELPPLVD